MKSNIIQKTIPFLLMVFAITIISCNKEEPFGGNKTKNGEYKIVVKQSGDIDDFNISASFTGGNTLNSGILNNAGEDLGMSYSLTSSEAKQSTYTYKTAKDGTLIIYTITAQSSDIYKKINVEVQLYFNLKLIDTRYRTFQGNDNSPWSVSWSQIE